MKKLDYGHEIFELLLSNRYESIERKVFNSINSNDNILKDEINKNFKLWLSKMIAKEKNDNIVSQLMLSKKIQRIIDGNDSYKLKMVYEDIYYEEMKLISREIFTNACAAIELNDIVIDDEKYQLYINKIESLGEKVSSIFKEEYCIEKSECYLDLTFLKNRGEVSTYSFRLHRYLFDN